jgi:hypothetical protein
MYFAPARAAGADCALVSDGRAARAAVAPPRVLRKLRRSDCVGFFVFIVSPGFDRGLYRLAIVSVG